MAAVVAAFQPGISIAEVAMRATGSSWWRRLIMFAADRGTCQAQSLHTCPWNHMLRNVAASVHSTVGVTSFVNVFISIRNL